MKAVRAAPASGLPSLSIALVAQTPWATAGPMPSSETRMAGASSRNIVASDEGAECRRMQRAPAGSSPAVVLPAGGWGLGGMFRAERQVAAYCRACLVTPRRGVAAALKQTAARNDPSGPETGLIGEWAHRAG